LLVIRRTINVEEMEEQRIETEGRTHLGLLTLMLEGCFLLQLLDQQILQPVSSGKVISLLGMLELGLGVGDINFDLTNLRPNVACF